MQPEQAALPDGVTGPVADPAEIDRASDPPVVTRSWREGHSRFERSAAGPPVAPTADHGRRRVTALLAGGGQRVLLSRIVLHIACTRHDGTLMSSTSLRCRPQWPPQSTPEKLWVIMEWDRIAMSLLLPEDY